MKTLIIDNYDSFTFNLYQYMAEIIGEQPVVIRNDQCDVENLNFAGYDNIIISPGPGRPDILNDFGICRYVLQQIEIPILGVCLGHQGIGYLAGGKVVYAPEVMHGRLSRIYHNGNELFDGIPDCFTAVRYHSLIIDKQLPSCLKKTAWTEDGIIMGITYNEKPIWGVQFHPESICTEYGKQILKNFCKLTQQYNKVNRQLDRQANPVGINENISVIPKKPDLQRLETVYKVCVKELSCFKDPEQVFMHFYRNDQNTIWLDSSLIMKGFSRFSFMGGSDGDLFFKVSYNCRKQEIIINKKGNTQVLHESIFDYLNRQIAKYHTSTPDIEFNFNCGFAGYFSYEMKHECGSPVVTASYFPDAVFLFLDRLIVFDYKLRKMYLLNLVETGREHDAQQWFESMTHDLNHLKPKKNLVPLITNGPVQFSLSRDYNTYLADIKKCLQYIKNGESYEICLTNKIKASLNLDPLSYYRTLRQSNPAPYGTYLRFNDFYIAGSSIERFLSIDKNKIVESKPMKGTIRRGRTKAEDENLCSFLKNDEKTKSENLMICDLIRNDLGIVCDIGTVHVPDLMAVETYATVHQMISLIRGKLRNDMTALDCIRASFPGGSMTGAPKKRTIEIIQSIEKESRGIYSGTIGYLALNDSADFNIVIRTAVITPSSFSVGVGGAIVTLSDPEAEFDEIILKGQALINSVQQLMPDKLIREYLLKGEKE